MPLRQQSQTAHPQLHFVFVNQGEARDEIAGYLHGQGIVHHNVLIAARKVPGAAFNGQALRRTMFFDAQGRLISTRVGALSEETLGEILNAIKDAAPGPAPGSR